MKKFGKNGENDNFWVTKVNIKYSKYNKLIPPNEIQTSFTTF